MYVCVRFNLDYDLIRHMLLAVPLSALSQRSFVQGAGGRRGQGAPDVGGGCWGPLRSGPLGAGGPRSPPSG